MYDCCWHAQGRTFVFIQAVDRESAVKVDELILSEFHGIGVLNVSCDMQVVIIAYCDQVCQNKAYYNLLNMFFILI